MEMRLSTKILSVLGLIAVVALIAIFVTRPAKQESEQPAQPETTPGEEATTAQPSRSLFAPRQPQTTPAVSDAPLETVVNDVNVITNWEERVDEVLLDTSEPDEKARKMLAFFPNLPADGQLEAVRHISNLISDNDYPQLGSYLTNTATSSDVIDELMADLLNRPDSIKLPMLLEIARNPQHPDAADAKDILELYLEEDYGNDWVLWQQKLGQWLKDHPE